MQKVNDPLVGRWFSPDCYFGAHNDFHYMDEDLRAGACATKENFLKYLEILRPDWMQVDSKGHSGNTSYFSKVPKASIAPHLKNDAVAAWREATREFGIPLICHYSGFLDWKAGRLYPEWLNVPPKGITRETCSFQNAMCPRSGYFDELMIPQLIELATEWEVDGFWIDGDWGFRGCWCDKCVTAFKEETGLDHVPESADDPDFSKWWDFQENSRLTTIKKYLDAVHQAKPEIIITSAWHQTLAYPHTEAINSDFLSGDLPFAWGSDYVRACPRYVSTQGKSWDMMLWSTVVHFQNGRRNMKSLEMLCQEAAPVLAAGGRVSFCENAFLRTSQMVPWRLRRLAEFGDFVRSRRSYCQDTQPLPEVAVLISRKLAKLPNLRQRTQPIRNAVLAMLDCHYNVEPCNETVLLPRINDFKLIVVPGDPDLEESTVSALRKYVEDGGKMLISGCKTAEKIGLEFCGISEMTVETVSPYAGEIQSYNARRDTMPMYYIKSNDAAFALFSERWGKIRPAADAAVHSYLYANQALEESQLDYPSAVTVRRGKGKLVCFPADLFCIYNHSRIREYRNFIDSLVKTVYTDRSIETALPSVVDVMFRKKGNKLFLHLLNNSTGSMRVTTQPLTSAPDEDVYLPSPAIDDIQEIGNISLQVKLKQKPLNVVMRPDRTTPDFTWENGVLNIRNLTVHIHNTVEIELTAESDYQ